MGVLKRSRAASNCRDHDRLLRSRYMPVYRDPILRFTEKWDLEAGTGCWIWNAALDHAGYSKFKKPRNRSWVTGHRWSYEFHVGPIPDEMEVDHICHVRACVNPLHLRLVTRRQNCENYAGLSSRNKSGYRGVSFAGRVGKWQASVWHKGQKNWLGYFDDVHEAGEAARLKRLELHTHNDLDRIVS